VKNFATIAEPLSQLTRKGTAFMITTSQERSPRLRSSRLLARILRSVWGDRSLPIGRRWRLTFWEPSLSCRTSSHQ